MNHNHDDDSDDDIPIPPGPITSADLIELTQRGTHPEDEPSIFQTKDLEVAPPINEPKLFYAGDIDDYSNSDDSESSSSNDHHEVCC